MPVSSISAFSFFSRRLSRLLLALFLNFFYTVGFAQQSLPNAILNYDCDRACLFNLVDQYLAGLKAKDPSTVDWADQVMFTENNVPLMIGDGLWGTITGMGDYDLRFADVDGGEAGFFGVVNEPDFSSLFALRLKTTRTHWKFVS